MLCYRLTRLVVYGLCVYHQNCEREREREREQCTGVCAMCTTALAVCISLQCGLGGPMVLDKTSGTYLNLEHGLCYHVKAQPKPYTLINNNHNNKKKLEAEAFW